MNKKQQYELNEIAKELAHADFNQANDLDSLGEIAKELAHADLKENL